MWTENKKACFHTKNRLLNDLVVKPADRTGLEPATSAVTGRHSNQLNYRSVFLKQNLIRFGIANIVSLIYFTTKNLK